MRKYLLYLVLITAGFTACKKEDDPVFEHSPDERINEILNKYQQELINAPHGWKGLVFPTGIPKSVFGFYLKFNDANRVSMFSDFDEASATTFRESSYRLKALQQPSLLFDTYSYIHTLCDPDANVNGGRFGVGLASDFEFSLDSLSADTIYLTGRFNKSKAVLVKASEAEAAAYTGLQRNREFQHINRFIAYWKRLTLGTKQYEIMVNVEHVIVFTWLDENGVRRQAETGFYYTPTGIELVPAFSDGQETISRIDNISWDEGNQVMRCLVNNANATITSFPRPLAPDTNGPKQWWEQGKGLIYWLGPYGFHSNGVDDAFGITTLPAYYFMGFWPGYDGGPYDLLGFVTVVDNEAVLSYGPGFRAPVFTADGRVTFSYYRDLGQFPADQTPITRTRNQLTDPSGFYLVRLAPNAWDMVSAKDGKTWITWFK